MSELPYPDGVPPALRRVLGKFVFLDWPPSLSEMTRSVSKTVLRYLQSDDVSQVAKTPLPFTFTKEDISHSISYIDSIISSHSDVEVNNFWNSLHTGVVVSTGNGGRRILEAICEGLSNATEPST